jgi:Arc/MetJ-type ribon-helix-helix transcriptional regulator
MTTEDEPIILVFSTLKKSVQLSPEVTAKIWDAVRRGAARNPEAYVHRALDRWLASQTGAKLPASETESEQAKGAK